MPAGNTKGSKLISVAALFSSLSTRSNRSWRFAPCGRRPLAHFQRCSTVLAVPLPRDQAAARDQIKGAGASPPAREFDVQGHWSTTLEDAIMAKPAYRAYTVIKRDDKDDYWLNAGAC